MVECAESLAALNGRLQYLYPTQYDVGVDNNNFTPISFEQVKRMIEKQVEQFHKK